MRHFDQFRSYEARHQPVSFAVGRVVVQKNIIGSLSSLRQALHGLFIRLGNCAKRHRLPSMTHSDQDAPDIQVGVLGRNEDYFRGVACVPSVL